MKKMTMAVALLGLSLPVMAQALEFHPVGNGSIGVGGAGVARTYGAMAPYWNPAGLAFAPDMVTVSLTAGAGLHPQGRLAQDLDDLSTADKAWNSSNKTSQSALPAANSLYDSLNALNNTTSKDNLRATGDAALGVQIHHFGFGVFGTFEGGSTPNPSSSTLLQPNDTNLNDGTFSSQVTTVLGQKTVTTRGIILTEVPISYGYAFDLGLAGKLGVGASAKFLNAWATSALDQHIFNGTDVSSSSDLTRDLTKNTKNSKSFGVDVGLLWKPIDSTAVGLVGKNLNEPSFKTNSGDKIFVDRQVRAGVAFDALSWLSLVGDVDVLSNSTLVTGLKTQHLGGGAEFHPFSSLKFRAGGYTDLVQTSSGAVTAGLSLGIPLVYLDFDGAYGLGSVKYNNHTYPSEGKAQVSMNIAF